MFSRTFDGYYFGLLILLPMDINLLFSELNAQRFLIIWCFQITPIVPVFQQVPFTKTSLFGIGT